jgi:hypothetical protein
MQDLFKIGIARGPYDDHTYYYDEAVFLTEEDALRFMVHKYGDIINHITIRDHLKEISTYEEWRVYEGAYTEKCVTPNPEFSSITNLGPDALKNNETKELYILHKQYENKLTDIQKNALKFLNHYSNEYNSITICTGNYFNSFEEYLEYEEIEELTPRAG